MTASGCVPCESFTNWTPSRIATRWRRCSTPSNAAAARRMAVRRQAEGEPDRDGGHGVRDVVAARDPELVDWHHAAGGLPDDPAVDHADAARPGRSEAVERDRRRAQVRVRGDDRVVGVEDQRAGRVDELGESPLRRAVALERAVPVEVVGRDVRVDRDRRAARQRRQLQLRQLDHDAMLRRQLRQALDERNPDVPAEHDRVRRVRCQDRGDQRRRRRLALRPGDTDRRRRAEAKEQVGLRDEGRAVTRPRRVPGAPPAVAARSSGSPG